jgi:hypothetical protein
MSNWLSEYDPSSGKIIRSISGNTTELLEANRREGFNYSLGLHDGRYFYVKDGELTSRPEMNAVADKPSINADGLDVLTISGLPTGKSDVSLVGPIRDQWSETKRKIELTVNMAGTYRLFISQWPYQDTEVTFNAT